MLKPTLDRVLVRKAPGAETKSAGGIVVPDNKQVPTDSGEVLSCGPGKTVAGVGLVPLGVAEGQRVLFPRGSGIQVKVDSEDLLLLREEDILGVLL